MQKGFATLEIIFMTFIIVILVLIAIPSVNRMIDRVALDYETKKLYTDLRFLQSQGRMTYMTDSHFKTENVDPLFLIIYPKQYILRKNATSEVFDEHFFSYGVNASEKTYNEYWQIKFDDMGKPQSLTNTALNGKITLTSRLKKKTEIIFDTVGRFRGGRANG